MISHRRGFILLMFMCLLLLLLPTASGSLVIDLPFMAPQKLPVNIPFFENISIGSSSPQAPTAYLHDGREILDSDLIVEKGQYLLLENYSLLLNCSYDGEHKIDVRDGGFIMIDNCSISPLDGDTAFLFHVEPGGRLVMRNSRLSGCGYNGPGSGSKGLWLESGANILDSNNLSRNYYGAVVDGPGCIFVNNTITSGYCGLLVGSGGATISNNTIENNYVGIDASRSGPITITGNGIYDNRLYGMLVGGGGLHLIERDDISGNGEGLIVLNASACQASEIQLDDNGGHGAIIDQSRVVSLRNVSASSNAWGIYINGTNDISVRGAVLDYNAFDGVFINNSNNILLLDSIASNNGGYGFNVTDNNTMVSVDRNRNSAFGNYKGDFNAPAAALSIVEVSLMSLLISLVDKLIYLVDIQKFILSNLLGGIVNPVRGPLSEELDRLSSRLKAMFHIKRKAYQKAHFSEHLGVLFFHVIDGKDIGGIARRLKPARLITNDIILQQIRFFDLLYRDRVMLFRNILYIVITTGIGVVVYWLQVLVGTYDLPYFLPLVIQFSIMFPICLTIQGNVVGLMDPLGYDAKDDASVAMLRDSVLRQIAGLEDRHDKKGISDKKFKKKMAGLSEALTAIDHMDVRRHYLLFTREGYSEAVSGFEALLKANPGEPLFLAGAAEAHAMLGRSIESGGGDGNSHYAKALEYAKKAHFLSPGRFEVRRALAMSLLFNGQIENARKETTVALKLNPGDAESYLVKAMMAETGEERRRLYKKAISINRNLSTVSLESLQVPVLAKAAIKR